MKNLLFIIFLLPLFVIAQGTKTTVNVQKDTAAINAQNRQAAMVVALGDSVRKLRTKVFTDSVFLDVTKLDKTDPLFMNRPQINTSLAARPRFDSLYKILDARTTFNYATFAKIDTLNGFIDTARFRIAFAGYPTKTQSDNSYQIKGNYLIPVDTNYLHQLAAGKLDSNTAKNSYQPKAVYLIPADTNSLGSRTTQNTAAISSNTAALAGKQPVGNYLTSEVDGSVSNELQNLSIVGQNLSISSGNTVTLPVQDLSGLQTKAKGQSDSATLRSQIPTNNNQLTNGAGFITSTALSPYLLSNTAASTYQPLLGFTPYNATNPAGYITSSALTPYKQASDSGKTGGQYVTAAGLRKSLDSIPQIVYLGNVSVAQTASIAILSGVRKVTVTGVTGLLTGDRILLTPAASTPVGYAIGDAVATANGIMEVTVNGPALALGASYSITCKTTVFR